MDLIWLGQSGFQITYSNKIIYIDPFKTNISIPADYILITHTHYDHFDLGVLQKIITQNTIIYCCVDARSKISKLNPKQIITCVPDQECKNDLFYLKTYPAYNLNKPYHPKENNWLGFLIKFKDISIYHAGDTDNLPQLQGLNANIILLPVSGTYVMNATEAASLANTMVFDRAIPMHWGSIVGSVEDAKEFCKLILKGKIPKLNKSILE